MLYRYSRVEDTNMTSPIPSDITKLDSNGDGTTDRIYVGDLKGKVWRISISDSGLTGRVVFNSNGKKMFYPPDVTMESDAGLYEALFFGTGDREHPKEVTSINRLYSVKDKGLPGTLTESDLVDVTLDKIQTGSEAEKQAINLQLKNGNGWYVKLDQNVGEKSLSQPVVWSGTVYYTTFGPTEGSESDPCFVGEGVARVYAMDYKTGGAVIDFDGNGTFDRSDRAKVIGTSIPSSVVIALRSEGLASGYVSVGGGIYTPPLKKNKSLVPVAWRRIF
jgi:type IV pilus assembly protein PilY1